MRAAIESGESGETGKLGAFARFCRNIHCCWAPSHLTRSVAGRSVGSVIQSTPGFDASGASCVAAFSSGASGSDGPMYTRISSASGATHLSI